MVFKRDLKVINVINFDFLELLSKEKGWNNFFYEIFKLLYDAKYVYDDSSKYLNLNIVVLDQIVAYVICINKEGVMIIENDIFLVNYDEAKYIAFCTCVCDNKQEHIVNELYKKVCKCLLVNRIDYKPTYDEIEIIDEDIKKHYRISHVIRLLNS